MAFTHAKNVDVFFDQFDLTAFFNSMDMSREVDNPETTVFSQNDRTYIAGLAGGTISLGGFWDSTVTTGVDEVLDATVGSSSISVVTIGPQGTAIGAPVYLFQTRSNSYGISGSVDGVVEVTTDLQATAEIDRGVALHILTAETATGDTNASSVDQTSQTTAGGAGHLHVTAMSTPTTIDVLVEDSNNDIAWLTVLTFAQVTTSTTSEHVALSSSAVVEQYLSSSWIIVGTSYTFAVAFGRR